MSIHLKMDFMSISSYGDAQKTSGIVRINKDMDSSITNKHVIIAEDIMDSGLTLSYLTRLLSERKPASLRVCALLDKPERRECEITPDYCGFTIPNKFVVGYGLDYKGYYRNLPYVGVPFVSPSLQRQQLPGGAEGGIVVAVPGGDVAGLGVEKEVVNLPRLVGQVLGGDADPLLLVV